MSVPTSMRVGPFAPTELPKKRYLLLYIFLIWATIIPIMLQFWGYWQLTWDYNRPIHFYIYLPLFAFLCYVELVLISLILARFLLSIVNTLHKPKEGTFLRDRNDKDYCYWCIRNTIKRWPVWLAHKFPFPFLDNLCFKMFGVKTKFSNSLFEGWVDTEFIEFGENVVVGQGSHIQSAVIMGNLLIIRKTIIEDDVRIGTHSVVMPGTHIGKKVALSTWSLTTIGQELEEGWIYHGCPAKKFKKNRFFEDGLEDKIQFRAETEERLEEVYKKYYRKHQEEHVSYIEQLKPRHERED
ncbi:MAG: acyltransferase [Promethearchaeati archaeon]